MAASEGLSFDGDAATVANGWAPLAELLAEHGFDHVLAIPLVADDGIVGAVNVYAADAPDDRDRHVLDLLAAQASAAIANARVFESTAQLADQLSTALESRAVIEQAKGVLMALQHCDEDQAFDILRRASQRSNKKLRDVAAELIAGTRPRRTPPGSPPPPPPPAPTG